MKNKVFYVGIGLNICFQGSADLDGLLLFPKLTLDIKAAEWTCLLGPSGVGKTTILRLIAGLDTAAVFHGEITVSDAQMREGKVAYMAQDDLLMPWLSVQENICIGPRLRGQSVDITQVQNMIERVGLSEHANKKPSELSGGQRQRVALARTLMEDRELILLDEPFSALDAKTRAEMQELAFDVFKGRTVLLVTHDPTEAARLAHSAYILYAGGAKKMPTPNTQPIRDFQDKDTLACQAELYKALRWGVS